MRVKNRLEDNKKWKGSRERNKVRERDESEERRGREDLVREGERRVRCDMQLY